nr:hypothetical protein [Tanacetum cinerariifolium]
MTSQVQQSIFHESSFDNTIRPDNACPSHLPGKELFVGSQEVDSKNLHDVIVPHWNIPNDALLDDLDTSREFIDHLDPLILFAHIRDIDNDELFTEFGVGTARQACLSVELRMRTEYSLNEKNSLNGKIIELQSSVSAKDLELKYVNAVVSSLRSLNDGLVDQRIEEFQDAQMKLINDKVAKLDLDFLEMACHLEEKFYPHLLTTIFGWRSVRDVATYNLNAEANFNSALQKLHEVDFPLLAKLKSHKDPDVEQLRVPIRRSKIQVVLRETSLLFSLNVSHSHVEQLRSVPPTACQRPLLLQRPYSTTFASVSSIPPITVDDYEVVNAYGQENSQRNVQGDFASFPTVDFKKGELDTTSECDLLN